MFGPFGEIRGASTAAGNAITAAVTAPAALCAWPVGAQYLYLEGRNYGTAVTVQFTLNPYLTIIKTTDNLAANANATDYSEVAQNNKPVTGAVVLSSFATSHALWLGADVPFRGVFAEVSAANGSAGTVAATYYSQTGPTMASLSISDGTIVTGASFGTSAAITWTVPTDWTAATLRVAGGAANAVQGGGLVKYWVRFTTSGAFDSSTTLNQLLSLNRSTSGAPLTSGRPGLWMELPTGANKAGCIEAKTDAGTASLVVIVATGPGGVFKS